LKYTVLIVEDEKEIADTLHYALSSEGMDAIWVSNGADAKHRLQTQTINFCVLDVGLPDCNGFDLLKEIRQLNTPNQHVPVLFLTARSEEIDRIIGLEIGADDYVCKPFSPREVVTRVKVILKRASQKSSIETTLHSDKSTIKGLVFQHNKDSCIIHHENIALDLTKAEYQLMAVFLAQPKRVFSRRQLIEAIWSSNHPSDDRAIDTHIKTLRAKLKTHNPHQDFIITHRGFGYSLNL